MADLTKFTFPAGTTSTDFELDNLLSLFDGNNVYMGKGTLTAAEIEAAIADDAALAAYLAANTTVVGELAEEGISYDSKAAVLKTHENAVEGKRTTPVTVKINGISNKTRAFFESSAFKVKTTFIVVNKEPNMVIVLNGLRWVYSHGGKTSGLNYGNFEASFDGSTVDKIYFAKDIPVAEEEPEA